MKRIKKLFNFAVIAVLAIAMAFSVIACGTDEENNGGGEGGGELPPVVPTITVTINNAPATIKTGETAHLTATVTGTDNTAVNWSSSNPAMLSVSEDGTLTVVQAPTLLDTNVTITATSLADTNAFAAKTIGVIAPRQEGQVGYLTSTMIQTLGGANITATGEIIDYYVDAHRSSNNKTHYYDMTVKMEQDKWSSNWAPRSGDPNQQAIVEVYKKGEKEVIYDANSEDYYNPQYQTGHELLTEYVDKDNVVKTKPITNYNSVPLAWENRHYWNHLSMLPINSFEIDRDDDTGCRYNYIIDESKEDEIILGAYIAYSITPLLGGDDYFDKFTLILDADHTKIIGMEASTHKYYTGAETDKQGNMTGYDTMSYSEAKIDFSDIGTTTVESLKAFDAPQHADKLTAALNKMKAATSYKFAVTERATYAPSTDPDDYITESLGNAPVYMAAKAAVDPADAEEYFDDRADDYAAFTGTIGTEGWVTPDAILMAETTSYQYYQEGEKPYRISYTGYKQVDATHYESFICQTHKMGEGDDAPKAQWLNGTKHVKGNVMDTMPTFDFSANLFKFVEEGVKNGKKTYKFTLLSTAITRAIAEELCISKYSKNGDPESSTALSIIVSEDGVVSCTFPYNAVRGTYLGFYTVNYSAIDSTAINMDKVFGNISGKDYGAFEERGILNNWSDYSVKDYFEDPSKPRYGEDGKHWQGKTENAQVAMQSVFGAAYTQLPTPAELHEIFDDNMFGPFYNDGKYTDSNGDEYYVREMSVTCSTLKVDENSVILNEAFLSVLDQLDTLLTGKGFQRTQFDISGGKSGLANRRVVYVTGDITIVIDNQRSDYFYFDFYNTADYNKLKASA